LAARTCSRSWSKSVAAACAIAIHAALLTAPTVFLVPTFAHFAKVLIFVPGCVCHSPEWSYLFLRGINGVLLLTEYVAAMKDTKEAWRRLP
jgi:hypothetical protein